MERLEESLMDKRHSTLGEPCGKGSGPISRGGNLTTGSIPVPSTNFEMGIPGWGILKEPSHKSLAARSILVSSINFV